MRKYTYQINDMCCNQEVLALKKALLNYVKNDSCLNFDLLNKSLTISVDPAIERNPDFYSEIIRSTGMSAELISSSGKRAAPKKDDPFWDRNGRSIMCILSGVLIFSGFLHHTFEHSFLDALGEYSEPGHQFPTLTLVLYVLSAFTGIWFIFPKAIFAVKSLRPDMNLLMTTAMTGAFILGEYFEAAAVMFLFSFALMLESWSIERARKAVGSLLELSPKTARIYNNKNEIVEYPVEEIPVDSTVIIRPGEKIPLDGVITIGNSHINQAQITGESIPIEKNPGDDVYAGSINGDNLIEIKTTKLFNDTTLSKIIYMVEEARSRRAPTEQWVERFALKYTPAVMILAVFFALFPPLFFSQMWSVWFYKALVLLVIACPCALVISTPVSIVAGLTSASKNGVLIKGGIHLENLSRLKAIAFDKTGTLTYGIPEVNEIIPLNDHSREDVLKIAASLETHSTHPMAKAILKKANEINSESVPAVDFKIIQGKGAEGIISNKKFWIGSHRYMHEKGLESEAYHKKAVELEGTGNTVIVLGEDDHICALISISDSVRKEAADSVSGLFDQGIKNIIMLTGDNHETAASVANTSGISEYYSELLPEDKVDAVRNSLKNYGKTAMVGDGVNDAPAMAEATLGIAMAGAGTDTAIETSDIALMSDNITKLPWLISHSKRTLRIIKQNIVIALGLKFAFIILAFIGAATLWMAIAADMGASILVIFNGLRLLKS